MRRQLEPQQREQPFLLRQKAVQISEMSSGFCFGKTGGEWEAVHLLERITGVSDYYSCFLLRKVASSSL